ETALGTDRHDDRVLDHLRLDQAQHLGAEILAAVGPAQPAARHRPEAQVHAFDTRAADPAFAVRARRGRVGHLGGIELERDVVGRAAIGAHAVGVLDVVAGAQGGIDATDEAAQDAVLVEAGDAVEQALEGAAYRVDLAFALAAEGVEHRLQDRARGLV